MALCVLITPTGLAVEAEVTLVHHHDPCMGGPAHCAAAATSMGVVSSMAAWRELAGVQPMTTPDDNSLAEVGLCGWLPTLFGACCCVHSLIPFPAQLDSCQM